jgi:hypothetical protein
LNLSGPDRDQQIQLFKNLGILNLEGRNILDSLAAKVFDVLWSKVEPSIGNTFIQSPESTLGEKILLFVVWISNNQSFNRAQPSTYAILPGRRATLERSAAARHIGVK